MYNYRVRKRKFKKESSWPDARPKEDHTLVHYVKSLYSKVKEKINEYKRN